MVVDDNGSVTGIQGNILENDTFLSKAKDALMVTYLLRHTTRTISSMVPSMCSWLQASIKR